MKKTAHHPLRTLASGRNPNRPGKVGNAYAPPLTAYLEVHDIDPVALQAFTAKVNGEVVTPFDPPYDHVYSLEARQSTAWRWQHR